MALSTGGNQEMGRLYFLCVKWEKGMKDRQLVLLLVCFFAAFWANLSFAQELKSLSEYDEGGPVTKGFKKDEAPFERVMSHVQCGVSEENLLWGFVRIPEEPFIALKRGVIALDDSARNGCRNRPVVMASEIEFTYEKEEFVKAKEEIAGYIVLQKKWGSRHRERTPGGSASYYAVFKDKSLPTVRTIYRESHNYGRSLSGFYDKGSPFSSWSGISPNPSDNGRSRLFNFGWHRFYWAKEHVREVLGVERGSVLVEARPVKEGSYYYNLEGPLIAFSDTKAHAEVVWDKLCDWLVRDRSEKTDVSFCDLTIEDLEDWDAPIE